MKVWERRLMKDFHVAPGEANESNEQSNERGIARFRRIAKQVAFSTSAYKWGEAVRGITDTQIGRCRNRESFRNQQNLQRAMDEAKRLVARSPVVSRACTPVEFYDPTTSTLLELLKNITEEVDELSPHSTVRTCGSNDRSHSSQKLNELFGYKPPSPLPPNLLQKLEAVSAMQSQDSTTNSRQQRQSISSILSQRSNEERDQNNIQSPEPTPRREFNILTAQSPPPLIQITRTESDKSMERPYVVKTASKDSKNENAEPPPSSSYVAESTAPKVIKRKAPVPLPTTSVDASPANDIAISRPVALKIDPKQGMIPPPPINDKKEMTTTTTSPTTTSPPLPTSSSNNVTADPALRTHSRTSSVVSPRPISPINTSTNQTTEQSSLVHKTNSTQSTLSTSAATLTTTSAQASPLKSATPSPQHSLRPPRKVIDVSTIKRQPKTGWL